jgi:hypothetical protein
MTGCSGLFTSSLDQKTIASIKIGSGFGEIQIETEASKDIDKDDERSESKGKDSKGKDSKWQELKEKEIINKDIKKKIRWDDNALKTRTF